MKAYEVDVSSLFFNGVEKIVHPVEVPDNGGATKLYALACPGVNLFHIERCSIIGTHVGLARDVGFIESHKMLGSLLLHFGNA